MSFSCCVLCVCTATLAQLVVALLIYSSKTRFATEFLLELKNDLRLQVRFGQVSCNGMHVLGNLCVNLISTQQLA